MQLVGLMCSCKLNLVKVVNHKYLSPLYFVTKSLVFRENVRILLYYIACQLYFAENLFFWFTKYPLFKSGIAGFKDARRVQKKLDYIEHRRFSLLMNLSSRFASPEFGKVSS